MSEKAQDGTHFRKVFDSPYLSSVDLVEPIVLTIQRVTQEADKTKKSKDTFNTAYFEERFMPWLLAGLLMLGLEKILSLTRMGRLP